MLFKSRRDRRIDRALSAVLSKIDDDHDDRLSRCRSHREINLLSIHCDKERNAAFDRANRSRAQWRARIAALLDD